MKVVLETEHPMTDAAVKDATGRTWEEWFAYLDARGGPSVGRRETTVHLYHELKIDIWWCATINMEYEAARGIKEKDGSSKGYMICATKTIGATIPEIFAQWETAEALSRWFGPDVQAEVKDGGAYSNADGDRGTFKRVRKDKDLRLTWENPAHTPGSIVDVTFQDKGKGKTTIMVAHDKIQTRAEADGLRAGWLEALGRLKEVLEKPA